MQSGTPKRAPARAGGGAAARAARHSERPAGRGRAARRRNPQRQFRPSRSDQDSRLRAGHAGSRRRRGRAAGKGGPHQPRSGSRDATRHRAAAGGRQRQGADLAQARGQAHAAVCAGLSRTRLRAAFARPLRRGDRRAPPGPRGRADDDGIGDPARLRLLRDQRPHQCRRRFRARAIGQSGASGSDPRFGRGADGRRRLSAGRRLVPPRARRPMPTTRRRASRSAIACSSSASPTPPTPACARPASAAGSFTARCFARCCSPAMAASGCARAPLRSSSRANNAR